MKYPCILIILRKYLPILVKTFRKQCISYHQRVAKATNNQMSIPYTVYLTTLKYDAQILHFGKSGGRGPNLVRKVPLLSAITIFHLHVLNT